MQIKTACAVFLECLRDFPVPERHEQANQRNCTVEQVMRQHGTEHASGFLHEQAVIHPEDDTGDELRDVQVRYGKRVEIEVDMRQRKHQRRNRNRHAPGQRIALGKLAKEGEYERDGHGTKQDFLAGAGK